MDNRERATARARDEKQMIGSSLEKQQEHFAAAVRKWEILAASKVKMNISEHEHK